MVTKNVEHFEKEACGLTSGRHEEEFMRYCEVWKGMTKEDYEQCGSQWALIDAGMNKGCLKLTKVQDI